MKSEAAFTMIDRRRTSQRPKKRGLKKSLYKYMLVKLPIDLAQKIDVFSAAAWRTQTAEIVRRLEASFENESIDEHGVIVVRSSSTAK